jgi:hypothetical protein
MSTAAVEFDIAHARPVHRRGGGPRRGTDGPRSHLRLTRRGRLVVFFGGMALAFAAFTLVSDPAVSTAERQQVRTETVVVTSGVTLWDIAEQVAPGADPRALIDEIVEINGLSDAGAIRVGQPIVVPVE